MFTKHEIIDDHPFVVNTILYELITHLIAAIHQIFYSTHEWSVRWDETTKEKRENCLHWVNKNQLYDNSWHFHAFINHFRSTVVHRGQRRRFIHEICFTIVTQMPQFSRLRSINLCLYVTIIYLPTFQSLLHYR